MLDSLFKLKFTSRITYGLTNELEYRKYLPAVNAMSLLGNKLDKEIKPIFVHSSISLCN